MDDTQEIKNKIYNYLKEGMLKKDAAVMVGIDESTFYRWVEADASFASRIKASIIEYKHSLIKIVNTSSIKDGRLALEVLKRRFPNDWNGSYDERVEDGKRDIERLVDSMDKIIAAGEKDESTKEKEN